MSNGSFKAFGLLLERVEQWSSLPSIPAPAPGTRNTGLLAAVSEPGTQLRGEPYYDILQYTIIYYNIL